MMKKILFYLFIIFLILFHYREIFNLPFIMDDWGWIELFYFNTPVKVIGYIFTLGYKIFFRPLAQLYFYGLFLIFNINPLPAHIAALCIHFINAILLIKVAKIFFTDRRLAFSCGLLYVSAFTIHLGTLSWIVGIYELGSICLFLLSFLAFIKNRKYLSCILFAFGLLFKEAIIILPIIFTLYLMIQNREKSFYINLGKKIYLHLLIIIFYITFRLKGILLLELPDNHSYSIDFIGKHLIQNGRLYLVWLIQSIFPYHIPFQGSMKSMFILIFVLILMTIFFYTLRQFMRKWSSHDLKLMVFFISWICIGLLPVIFFKSHIYRYYLTVSLIGFILLTVYIADKILIGFFCKIPYYQKRFYSIFIGLILLGLAIRSQLFQINHASAMNLYAGTNRQVNTAKEITIVRDGLLGYHDILPDSTVIILSGVNVWSFSKDSGIRVWYQNPSLEVFDKLHIKIDSTGLYLITHFERDKIEIKKRRLDPDRTLFFQRIGDQLQLNSILVD